MRWSLALALALALVAACAPGDPCDDVAGTCVTLRVTSSVASAIDKLELDILYPAFHATAVTSGEVTSLPLATAVELAGVTDTVAVDIVAAGKLSGAVLGTGYQPIESLAPDDHATLVIEIAPKDPPCVLGTYCGGTKVDGNKDVLYLCHPGGISDPDGDLEPNVPTARGLCVNGCNHNNNDDDLCNGGNQPCTQGNNYCGGHNVTGDPQWLYRCTTTGPVFVADCTASGKLCGPATADSDACH